MNQLDGYIRKGYFYEAVVEDGSDIIFIVDFSGKIFYHNASVHETLGYRAKSLIGKNFFEYIHPKTREELKSKFKHSQKRAYTEKVEFQFLCANKSYRFLEYNAINLKHKEGLNGFILDCRDIAQRKRDAEELVKLQKAKEQFLANISHEIRTPINGITGMANLLSQNPSTEERETYLNAIIHSADNLKVIINDILDLAVIESGKLKFEKIAFNLKDLVPSLISTFTYQAREKKITLDYDIDERLNKILLGDPVRLNQILINLISNAVKFTHRGSIHIDCSIERQQKGVCWVRIEVKDTGIGIPSEKLNTIFESFSQADASVTRKYGGSGLGLTIVKQLVELQNGKITVRSEEHKGSTFIALIPYPIGNTKDFKKNPVNDVIKRNNALSSQPLHVLLVEDNDINRLYAKSILKNWHCKTDTAENGLVALEHIKNYQYDVILMDIQMPIMDGYETTKAIRLMDAPLKDIPIIALTANASKIDVEKCLAAGMDDILSKPFTPDDLFKKLFDDVKIVPAKKIGKEKKIEVVAAKKLYDLNYLRKVSDNNKEFINEMIKTFIQTIPQVLSEMEICVKEKDWEKLSKLAHQIKPTYTLLGLDAIKESLLYIELEAKKKEKLDDLKDVTLKFIKQSNSVIPDLEKELI
jgi:PAS domain S-box-containing protein